MQKNHTILITLATLLLAGCAASGNIEHLCRQAEELMTERPDSAYTLLTTVRNGDVSPERLQARHALLLAQATDKCYIDSDNDSLTLTAYNYFFRRGTASQRALSAYYHARVLQNGGNKEEATRFFLEAKDDAVALDDQYLIGLVCNQLGELYYDSCVFDEALQYYTKSYEAYDTIGKESHKMYECSRIAQTNLQLGVLDAAFDRYNEYLNYNLRHNPQLVAEDYRNLAFVRYKQERFQDALEIISGVNVTSSYMGCLVYADIYKAFDKIDQAVNLYSKAQSSNNLLICSTASFHLYEIAKMRHRYDKALQCYEMYSAARDSIMTQRLREDILSVERRYDKQKVEFDNYRLAAKHRVDVLLIAVCGLVILLLALLFSVYAKRKRARIEEYCLVVQNLETSHETLIQTLDNKSVVESRLKELLDRRFDFIRKVAAEAYVHFDGNKSKMAQTINDMLKIDSNNNELFADLYDVVNLRYNGALDRLTECYQTKLSRRDIELCALLGSGFGVNEICALYRGTLSPEAVYRRRSRLKAKFGVTDHLDMCELLNKWSHSSELSDETLTNQTNRK